jgi:hypothetical protein
MLELIALWGLLGGLGRALAGFVTYGRPPRKSIPLVFLITGFVGIVSAFAAFCFGISYYSLAAWKSAAIAALVGYVGVDILNSLFEILRERGIEI